VGLIMPSRLRPLVLLGLLGLLGCERAPSDPIPRPQIGNDAYVYWQDDDAAVLLFPRMEDMEEVQQAAKIGDIEMVRRLQERAQRLPSNTRVRLVEMRSEACRVKGTDDEGYVRCENVFARPRGR
jgi:hypothetical protein